MLDLSIFSAICACIGIIKNNLKFTKKVGQWWDKFMAYKWYKTKYTGVRYREHPTRKHGILPDRYFTIRYKINGKSYEEKLGWGSEGITAEKAFNIRCKILEKYTLGQEIETLKDKRQKAELELHKKQEEMARQEKYNISFSNFYENVYKPIAKMYIKENTFKTETSLYEKWLKPILENEKINNITIQSVEKIENTMFKANLSKRSVEYALIILRKILKYAEEHGYIQNKLVQIKTGKYTYDNKRIRFLTLKEEHDLLNILNIRNIQLYMICLLALHCGLRAGEIFNLTWNDVNFANKTITIKDPKNSKNRTAYMSNKVYAELQKWGQKQANYLLFKNEKGQKIESISNTFDRVIKELGWNNNVTDTRDKVVFHTLRHTYASRLVQSGMDLYKVQKLMGHSSIAMTERYAHLAPQNLQQAVEIFNKQEEKTDECK